MKKQLVTSLTLALVTALAGCSSGGTAETPAPASPAVGASTAKVAGPLDAIQNPVSDQIMTPLAAAVSGTPLEGIVICANQVVVIDAIDIVDAAAVAIQATDPTALASAKTAENLQNQLQNTVVGLQGMLVAMAGKANGCTLNTAPTGSNPLAGTPLSPVGAALEPVLKQIFDAVAGSGGNPSPDLALVTIRNYYSQLNGAVQTAFAMVPSQVSSAPVLGDAILAVKNALNQANSVVSAVAANNPALAQVAIASAVNSILKSVLLNVVPIYAIEAQAGHVGLLSTPLANAIDTVTATFSGTKLDTTQPTVLVTQITTTLAPVLQPLQNEVVANIAGPLFDAINGATAPIGSPLTPVTTLLSSFLVGSPTPLAYVTTTIEQIVAGGAPCPTTGTPLAFVCSLHLGLPL